MSEFVHLHLHTEFSLLDGACRIGELLDRAAELKMPAVAVTEHGNMFSAVTFHDEAAQARHQADPRLRGLRRAGRAGRDRSGHARRDRESSRAARRRRTRASTTSSSSSRRATPTASTTSRASTRTLLAQHSRGLIGLSSCLKGEVATGLRTDQTRKALEAAATLPRHPRPRQFLPRDAVPGHRRAARSSTPACCRSRATSACRSSARTTCTTCGRPTSIRTTCCSASARARTSATRSG